MSPERNPKETDVPRSPEPLPIITNFALRGGAGNMLARYAGSAESGRGDPPW